MSESDTTKSTPAGKPAGTPKKGRTNPRKEKERRRFLRSVGLTAGVVGFSLAGLLPAMQRWQPRLRPPGALSAEQEFLASCIKCGQCVQVCPVYAIKLADLLDGAGNGAPYIDARMQACDFSCDGLQCVLACPTGALSHDTDFPHQVRIGYAELDRPDLCLARKGQGFQGKVRGPEFDGLFRYNEIDRWNPIPVRDRDFDLELCDLCVRHCPIEIRIAQCDAGNPPSGDVNQCPPKHALTIEEVEDASGKMVMSPVVQEGCVGCGACEMVCPTEPASIIVDMTKSADTV